jgi:hypothetical protein
MDEQQKAAMPLVRLLLAIGKEQSGSPTASAGLIRAAARTAATVARGTHECFQGRLQLGYSRSHDGHPSPSQNREWMILRDSLGQQSPTLKAATAAESPRFAFSKPSPPYGGDGLERLAALPTAGSRDEARA